MTCEACKAFLTSHTEELAIIAARLIEEDKPELILKAKELAQQMAEKLGMSESHFCVKSLTSGNIIQARQTLFRAVRHLSVTCDMLNRADNFPPCDVLQEEIRNILRL